MYHWYLLARDAGAGSADAKAGQIVAASPADGQDRPAARPADRWVLFWIGLLDALPILVGFVTAGFLRSWLVWAGAVVLGALGSLLVTWFFRHRIPPTPAESRPTRPRDEAA